eukprot:242955_1
MALKLAQQLAPTEIPQICREYGQQLEFKGEYAQAQRMYERGFDRHAHTGESARVNANHQNMCRAGITRMTIRLGDIQKGREMAIESGETELIKECAVILESMKQFSDAADLYVKANQFEKAAAIYIHAKQFRSAAPLMKHISTPKLHSLYAKAKEAEGSYSEAAEAYTTAKDLDSVVRLNLFHLDNPQKAFSLVRETRSADGAALVAQYCQKHRNYKVAIEFLLFAKNMSAAFEMAQLHGEMDGFTEALGNSGSREDYLNVATYYESKHDWAHAGDFFMLCGDFMKAMKLFLQCGDDELGKCIEVIKKALTHPDIDTLIRTLHDYLTGETDGTAKDPNYMFKLYLAIGDFVQAAKIAILIANQEQQMGAYKVAHDVLFDTFRDLRAERIPIPDELNRNLLLLHSYVIVKSLVKSGDHEAAARMLIRVAQSISKFPTHIVPILTSTVIECQRAKLLKSSHEFASMLMRPEYRPHLNAKYKRKIESIVRRSVGEEASEEQSPCPFCSFEIPKSLLDCPNCRNQVPFCIVTGQHMVVSDWSECPNCSFPALLSKFRTFAAETTSCPMCGDKVDSTKLVRLADPVEKWRKE